MSPSLRSHGLQHIRPPCPSSTLQLAQTHVHQVGEDIQPSHPLLFPSPPAFNLSQHQGLFQWVSSLHQVAKVCIYCIYNIYIYIYMLYIHIYNRILLGHKNNEIFPFATTWMDLVITTLSEVSQTKTNIILYHLYVKYKTKKCYKCIYLQNRNRLTDI